MDFAYPQRRLAVELDGFESHGQRDAFDRDRARQNQLVLLGWTVLRFTWADVTERPETVAAALAQSSKPGGGSMTTRPGRWSTTNTRCTSRSPESTRRSEAGLASTDSTTP